LSENRRGAGMRGKDAEPLVALSTSQSRD